MKPTRPLRRGALGLAAALFVAGRASANPCSPFLDVRLTHPEPTYLAVGESSPVRLLVVEAGSATETVYGLTLTTISGAFDQRTFVAGSLSATGYNGAVADVSWSADGTTWTPGEPPDGTTEPLSLRFALPTMSGGQTLEASWRTLVQPGAEATLETAISATLGCDPAQTQETDLPAIAMTRAGRIQAPTRWVALHGGPQHGMDAVRGVARAPGGHLVVAGDQEVAGGGSDIWIRNVDSETGATLASTTWTETNGLYHHAQAVAVAPTGEVYVAGYFDNGATLADWVVLKYDAGLTTLLGFAVANGPANGADQANAIALNALGQVVVAGGETQPGTGMDVAIKVWNPALTAVLSSTTFAGTEPGGADIANAVAMAPDGGIVAGGFVTVPGGTSDDLVIKFAGGLDRLVGYVTHDGAGENDQVNGLVVDPNGWITTIGDVSFSGQRDWYLSSWYPNAQFQSNAFSIPGPGGLDDTGAAIALDAKGNLLVAGAFADPTTGLDWEVRMYDNFFNQIFQRSHQGVLGMEDVLTAVVSGGSGTVFVAGYERAQDESWQQGVARYDLPAFDPPATPTGVVATSLPGGALLDWDPLVPGTRSLNGWIVFRASYPGFPSDFSYQVGSNLDPAGTFFVDSGVPSGETAYYRVQAFDTSNCRSFLSADAAVVAGCVPTLSVSLPRTLPQYAAAGQVQMWRLEFVNSGSTTQYGVNLIVQQGGTAARNYVGPSFSASRTGGAPTDISYSADGTAWTPGEPPDGTPDPLWLRFSLPAVAPGETGAVAWKATPTAGVPGTLVAVVSATLSCDPGGTLPASMPNIDARMAARIDAPFSWIQDDFLDSDASSQGGVWQWTHLPASLWRPPRTARSWGRGRTPC